MTNKEKKTYLGHQLVELDEKIATACGESNYKEAGNFCGQAVEIHEWINEIPSDEPPANDQARPRTHSSDGDDG